jgi:excisionase family DNA binding protein
MMTRLLLVREAAEILRVAPARVYALVRLGQLPAVLLGERQVRIVEVALLEWIRSGGAKAAAAAPANQRATSEPEVRRG